ncbi:hypothetical protein [Sporocytophaga myxococcoides]|uniref:hypothetical protein n=1 Tax=Sporocytophaga myxococcoides TaxID=153721 RepID=UPI00040720C0|nr:hypothetical protein [Sporocytophaga myxococcoides]
MQPSDFLTILGLALAVWAIIPSKERRFILLFFSKFEIGVFIASLFVIHYLMCFDWLMANWFPCLSIFTVDNGLPSSTWAYMIALTIIFFPIVKVSFGYFSASRLKSMIALYETYLKENEIDLLVNYITKYHIKDIRKYLQGISHLPQKESIDIILRRRTDKDKAYDKLVEPKRILFASWVYGHIIQNENFVRKTANKYPELFATAFSGMETKESSNEDLVKLYIECLFENKNQLLIQELKIMNGTNSSVLEMNKNYDIPILFSLFAHTKVASENYVWYPVGEEAVKSLKHDSVQKEFLTKKYDHDLESELWNQKIYIAIVYFNYMVRETIYRDSEWHMWLFYFRHFTDLLIEIIPSPNDYEGNSEYPSFAHKMIYEQFSIMTNWLDLAKEQETDNRVIDTIRCLGWCVHSICQADNSKISVWFRRRQLDLILSTYFKFSHYPDNIAATTARQWLEKLFLNPKGVDFGVPERTNEYLAALQDAWNEFDKIPYQYHEDNGSIQHFVTTVLTPIGLNE